MDKKLDAAIKEVAMGQLLGEYDASDVAPELAEEFPHAWDQLPRDAKLQGMAWAEDAANDADTPEEQEGLAERMRHLMNAGAIHHEIERMVAAARPAPTAESGSAPTPGPESGHGDRADWAAGFDPDHGARLAACLMMQACDTDGGQPNPDAVEAFAREMGPDYAASFMHYAAQVCHKAR